MDNNYITSGIHAIEEYVKSGSTGTLYITSNQNKRVQDILERARKNNFKIITQDPKNLVQTAVSFGIEDEVRGIFLVGTHPDRNKFNSFEEFVNSLNSDNPHEPCLVLVLQDITDPHNLGAILRTADQFQIDGVVLPQRRSASINPTVSRISSGADQFVPSYRVTNLVRSVELLKKKGFWIYGADMKGVTSSELNLSGKICLIMGSEGKGIGKLLEGHCDQLISIPTGGKIDSLNVSVATGILCYEVRRQQNYPYKSQ